MTAKDFGKGLVCTVMLVVLKFVLHSALYLQFALHIHSRHPQSPPDISRVAPERRPHAQTAGDAVNGREKREPDGVRADEIHVIVHGFLHLPSDPGGIHAG
jgi:hypothetical protein